MPSKLELLAPARDADTAIVAIRHGADAVYIGGPAFGARAAAGNSIDDIRRVADFAHTFGAKVYVTINTIIYDNELEQVRGLVSELYRAGVDALIVQDMALLMMDIPPIDLHASTQCDARDLSKIKVLADAGFSQIVLPREFSLEEISRAAEAAAPARIECFVHGALCVSYSGDCQAGYVTMGRSANRGECPQICRLKFTLTDSAGRPLSPRDGLGSDRHWLSLADMCRIAQLRQMADAGVRSFKIEGRLKGESYVKEVVSAYSKALDKVVAESGGAYERASHGRVEYSFAPDLSAAFNRGFTPYFLTKNDQKGIISAITPKFTGPEIGRFEGISGRALRIKSTVEIHPGDGLGWFDEQNTLRGFRVNRVEGSLIFPAPKSDIPRKIGTKIYRNSDFLREKALSRDETARRVIDIDATLRIDSLNRIVADLRDSSGIQISVASDHIVLQEARTSQEEARKNIFEKLGNTEFSLNNFEDQIGAIFVPAKSLTDLRRRAIEALRLARRLAYRPMRRRTDKLAPDALRSLVTDYHCNVANSLAADFYTKHGARIDEKAIEVEPRKGELRVMTTRYCLRREMGECLRERITDRRLPLGDLYLDAPVGRFRLHNDCTKCVTHVLINVKK